MHQRLFPAALLFLLTILYEIPNGSANPQKTVLEVGSRSQLFIEREVVFDARGVSFTFHPARKVSREPLLKPDQPCEGKSVQLYGTVLYDADEKIFKMWYLGARSDYFSREVTFYATSRDGIRWDKRHRGTIESDNGKPHNAVADCLLASVMKDPHDPDPSRRYKMVCYQYDRGYCSMVSADGLHWRDTGPGTILPMSYVEDVITACWSDTHQRFVVFAKQCMPVMGRRRRTMWTSFSHDFAHWSEARPAIVADRRDDFGSRIRSEQVRPLLKYPDNPSVMRAEIYGMGAYAAESCLIGFPWIFTATLNVPNYGNQDGPMEVQFAVTRDLKEWQRPFRQPAIELDQPGRWDGGMLCTASYAFDHQDEVRLYYFGSSHTHGPVDQTERKYRTGIGLATWQKDRFVSADGPPGGATLTTVPLEFSGSRLELNANVKPQGKIVVELLDLSLRRLGHWPASQSVVGDDLRHVVKFGEVQDVSELAGKPLILRFHLVDAQLYAFAFRE